MRVGDVQNKECCNSLIGPCNILYLNTNIDICPYIYTHITVYVYIYMHV